MPCPHRYSTGKKGETAAVANAPQDLEDDAIGDAVSDVMAVIVFAIQTTRIVLKILAKMSRAHCSMLCSYLIMIWMALLDPSVL